MFDFFGTKISESPVYLLVAILTMSISRILVIELLNLNVYIWLTAWFMTGFLLMRFIESNFKPLRVT